MKTLIIRIERAHADPAKDTLRARENDLSFECLQEMKKYQEMITQFHIILFSPEIQGGGPQVSSKKLGQQWQEIDKYY